MKRTAALLVLLATTFGLCGCSGTAAAPSQPPEMAPSISLNASPSSIASGAATTLSWSSSNATSVAINQGVGSVPLSGSVVVIPDSTVQYQATAKGPGGSSQASVTVQVSQRASLQFLATPNTISSGQTATLNWSAPGASSVTISPGLGQFGPSGSVTVSPNVTTTYTAVATASGGNLHATVTVTVTPAQSGSPSVSLTASPSFLTAGQTATLTWTSTNASTVVISNGIGPVGLSGSATVTPSITTSYTATATGAAGTATATATVAVNAGNLQSINHIIFMLQENRSFDNYFGHLNAYRTQLGLPADVNGTPANASNPSYDGTTTVSAFPYATVCTENLAANWGPSHTDYNRYNSTSGIATLDGFVYEAAADSIRNNVTDQLGLRAMGYYDENYLPFYYYMASQFATSDNWFSPVMARTIPNRLYLMAATSQGNIDSPTSPLTAKTIFQLLDQNHVTWKIYTIGTFTYLSLFQPYTSTLPPNVVPISQFFTDLAKGTLPSVALIETTGGMDEHPKYNINNQVGAAYVAGLINALMSSTSWDDSAFILTYDEGGGLYDHVPPVPTVNPDGISPISGAPYVFDDFTYTGFRVPLIVISPYSKAHYVSHTAADYTAILKLVETRFNLPSLTKRDAAQMDMTEFFDFANVPWLNPPHPPAQPTNGPCTPAQLQ